MKYFIGLFLITFTACNNGSACGVNNENDLGTIVDANEMPTSWNDTYRMRIKTTKGIYFINGIHSFLIGDSVIGGHDSCQSGYYLCFKTNPTCYRVIQ
jgi:hypothetical protein